MQRVLGRNPSTGQPVAAPHWTWRSMICAPALLDELRAFLGGSDERRTMQLSYTLTGHDRASSSKR
ncbi:MAG: hypothetical protein R2856_17360 [Caldilineaceae bacterium]